LDLLPSISLLLSSPLLILLFSYRYSGTAP